ncbi:uncharacterized protein METZ01_LOCUS233867 [marine metagenome]|uniref:Uncharacterized protein n=1 Tax=marine metagenome TaxID=408172 RepID=A0A382H2J8_9ZZZZ
MVGYRNPITVADVNVTIQPYTK